MRMTVCARMLRMPRMAAGIDFRIKTLQIGGKKIKLQIWDTAGLERFRTITTAYYRGAMGAALVYDATKERSFESIKTTWINLVRVCS